MILQYFYEQVRECALKRNFEQHIPIYFKKISKNDDIFRTP